jgi:hypothetical protein
MSLCLLASLVKRYHLDKNKLKKIIDCKYKTTNPNVFACLMLAPLLFRKVYFGLLGLQRWGIVESRECEEG